MKTELILEFILTFSLRLRAGFNNHFSWAELIMLSNKFSTLDRKEANFWVVNIKT